MLVEDLPRHARDDEAHARVTQGCRVVEASNGQEAIELSQRGELDLVLMDLNMPVLDGFTRRCAYASTSGRATCPSSP
jgi:CheY-like chemotaxis protein